LLSQQVISDDAGSRSSACWAIHPSPAPTSSQWVGWRSTFIWCRTRRKKAQRVVSQGCRVARLPERSLRSIGLASVLTVRTDWAEWSRVEQDVLHAICDAGSAEAYCLTAAYACPWRATCGGWRRITQSGRQVRTTSGGRTLAMPHQGALKPARPTMRATDGRVAGATLPEWAGSNSSVIVGQL